MDRGDGLNKMEKDDSEKLDKKKIMSNDLIERMIRIEQQVSASFGEKVVYNKTKYYESLTASEKKGFEDYLKKRKRRKFILPLFLIAPIIAIFFRVSFTGRVIDESATSTSPSVWVLIIFALISVFLVYFAVKRYIRSKSDMKHLAVVESILNKRHVPKH